MATATKTSLQKWICTASNLIALIQSCSIHQMLANFLELNSKGLYQSLGKEEESFCLVFPSWTKCDIRQFHIVIMQWRQRNAQRRVTHKQSCNVNLLLFLSSLSLLLLLLNLQINFSNKKKKKFLLQGSPLSETTCHPFPLPPCETSSAKNYVFEYCVFSFFVFFSE